MKLVPRPSIECSLTLMAILCAGGFVAGCADAPLSAPVPTVFHGEWTPDDAELRGRAFHLSARELTVTVDASLRYVLEVKRVEVRERLDVTVMAIHHLNRDGEDDVLTLHYADASPGFVRLDETSEVRWIRTDESVVSSAARRPPIRAEGVPPKIASIR